MTAVAKRQTRVPPCGQNGFTLVELMVALTIGLFLVIGLIGLLVSMSHSRTELDKTSRHIENGRYALQLLVTDIQHAGFLGNYTPNTATYTAPVPCDTATAASMADLGFNNSATPTVPVFLFGYDGAAANPACVTNRAPGTAVLVVRRVSTTPTTVASAAAGETYVQVDACAPLIPPFVVSSTAANLILQTKDCGGNLAPLNKYMVRIYYVSTCNVCSPSDDIPTLKIAEFVGGAMTVRPLVEGIQNLQFDYGVDMNNDGSPDCYITNPTSPAAAQIDVAVCPQPAAPPAYVWTDATTNWSNVVSVRIHVLARTTEASAGWTDTRTYDLGKAGPYTPAAGDQYKRHVFTAVARAVNVASRKEQP